VCGINEIKPWYGTPLRTSTIPELVFIGKIKNKN
jgi:hypothetical protein